ncbi:MAG: undecaprenyl-phosphate glucose phosphotransferase [Bacteroidaceae bacterium]|nr:undecaprenyl-phosphate glucose phosphotransferase [Bacteroidaceae bacterium]MBQ4460887.1 undecaprenyl-phosphate glucose phosphotransferase [Bacteroidaceae bacterium]MBR6369301.1 undecaprenyl-phosphate glucose phosphotransferase [Bacteroidaceae bacterium]
MKQTLQTSYLIKGLVICVDALLMLGFTMVVYYFMTGLIPFTAYLHYKMYMLLSLLAFIFSDFIFPPLLQMRKVKPEKIVVNLIYFIIVYMMLLIAMLSFVDVNMLSLKFVLVTSSIIWLLLVVWRLSCRVLVKKIRTLGRNSRTIIFVGASQNMVDLYREILNDPSTGYKVLGYIDNSKNDNLGSLPYLGDMSVLYDYLTENHTNIDMLFYASTSSDVDNARKLINFCDNHIIRFYQVPNLYSYFRRELKLELMGDIPVLYVREEPLLNPFNRFIKRSFDIVAACLFLFTIFPFVYIIVGTIIKITSPGPIFFKQKRNGLDGKEFFCYKFRSMKVNNDADKVQATKNDPRKYPFGNFMRRTNIDELPQFINVLNGTMSIVGPRPHMVKHTEEYGALIDKYMVRHLAKPGITGWAQVKGCRGETKELYQMEERIEKDIWYVENWSFLLDLRIIFMTAFNMFFTKEENAY